ncbi:MAG: DUF58 domain-containing protein [Planctomycetota bacterium]|nr:DUF58 domain-containing protein [Planctomycetota bacterium]
MASQHTHTQSSTPSGPRREARSFIDPQALMRIESLQLRAASVVEGFLHGLHRSPYHGFSVEFSEYREYLPGDDLRFLDWRVFARTDRFYIKRFEDETNLRCELLVDTSRSMSFGSDTFSKLDYTRTLAATIAYFLSLQRDAVGLRAFDERIVETLPARYRPGHLNRLLLALERTPAGEGTDLSAPLEEVAATVTKRGMIVLISDLLAPLDKLDKSLGYLRSRGHEVILLRVLDPAEIDFSFDTPTMFRDVESGQQRYVDPQSARSEYQSRFREHADAIKTTCDVLGIDLYEMPTDQPFELSLFDFIQSRQQRSRHVARRSNRPRRDA